MRLIIISVLIFLMTIVGIGQTNRGGISGTVTDPKGATIPGATVTITNLGTNKKSVLTTSEEGSFSINSLDPVLYDISVEITGFKKALIQKVKVDTATVSTVNVVLELGTVNRISIQIELND